MGRVYFGCLGPAAPGPGPDPERPASWPRGTAFGASADGQPPIRGYDTFVRDEGPDPVATVGGAAQPPPASPLDVFPQLTTLAAVLADAMVVTDLERRVVVWNEPAARLFGISREEAIGNPIESLYDSVIMGEGSSWVVARTHALEHGSWRGRVVDRPRLGTRLGEELVIETDLSRLDGPDGRAVGIISVKRDVTATVRIERALDALNSLVTATGEARTRVGFAERALSVLITTTGAQHGAILGGQDGASRMLARHNVPDAIYAATMRTPWTEAPSIRAVATPGRVIIGSVDRMPLLPTTRLAFLDAGIRTMMVVGLHREDELVGLLTLGWHEEAPAIPSDAAWWLVATTIGRGMENARLLEEIVRRADLERESTARLRTLDDLTRLPDAVESLQELADRSAWLLHHALGATGTAYGLLAPDGTGYPTWSLVDVDPMVLEWLQTDQSIVREGYRRWRAGDGPVLETFDPGVVPMGIIELARGAGLTGYAAFPIRDGQDLVGAALSYFDRPLADVHLDRNLLDRVSTALSVAIATFRLREQLEASHHRFRTLFESSPDALFIERLDGTVLEVNDAAEGMFRAERARMIGLGLADLAVEEPSWPRLLTAVQRPDAAFRVRATGIRSDGDRFPQEVDIRRIELDGEARLLVRVRDLTEQERLQSELVQAQKMEATGHLVSGVAHELNNPLAAILGFSQLIRRDQGLPQDLRHNADLLVDEATRTRRIVRDLLDFARQRPPERHPTSIATLIDSVVTLQSYHLGAGRIELEVEVEPDLPPVELDRGQLQQVLVNLTQNAIDAIQSGGGSRVRIVAGMETHAGGDDVRITVLDDGPGVPPDVVERLFEAFYTTKGAGHGTGLGLPVSAGIVRSHGGDLRYVPSPLGRGAAFTFDLPIHAVALDPTAIFASLAEPSRPIADDDDEGTDDETPAAVAPPAVTTPVTEDGARPRVLVLDDEPAIRIFLTKALSGLGYDVVATDSGHDAIDQALATTFDAFIVDRHLGDTSGIDVYEAIVAARPADAARFVLMSGDVLDPTLEAFSSATGVGLLAKPFDLETLDRTVRGLLPASDDPGAGDATASGAAAQPRGYV